MGRNLPQHPMQQTSKVNILLGASGTEDDSGSGSNNSGSARHYNRKLFHRRQRIPPKKLEVRTPSVQELEYKEKKSKSKNHQNQHHHRAVWYFLFLQNFALFLN